LKKMA